ncbi:MAG TPA: PAS domain S-box protein [Vicinamibacterales bacterium]|nr:PAS domain S-box protein [Vicinamibacterales bacterium]
MSRLTLDELASRYAAIVESSDDAIISTDLSGTVTSWNRAAERIFGYSDAEMIGKPIEAIVPSTRSSRDADMRDRVERGHAVEHFETTGQRKDGTIIALSVAFSPIRDARGTVIGAARVARDVTSRAASERAARHLAAIVATSDDAIVSKDLDGIVMSWNAAAQRIFGYTADEMIGASIRTIIPADRQAEEDRVLATIRSGQRVEHFETIRRRKDGTLIPVSLTVSPILAPDGRIIGASKIARDISERVKAESERLQLLRAVQEASRVKDEFLATLSHELRTPLNAILGYSRMVRSGLLTGEKQDRGIETIERNATSLAQIVEDVLDMSRIMSGKLRLHIQPIDLGRLVRDAVAGLMPAAEAKGVTIETVVDASLTPSAGDPDRLQQVLWNLLSNAVKFSGRGAYVSVHVTRAGRQASIVVSDTGIGISAEFLPHLFERFRQADAGTTRERGGLGLGLAIARQLVELHGGTIEAASPGPGKGSTFTVTLPLRDPAVDTADRAEERPAGARTLPVPHLEGVRVLAVDDDRDALRLVREILEATGAQVSTAASATEALDQLHQSEQDVLIADIGMPLMDGFDLIRHVRASPVPGVRGVAAAALTAYARSEDAARATKSGYQMHLSKPIDPAQLMAAVAALAGRDGSRH